VKTSNLTKATLSVDIVRVKFNPNGHHNNAVHISEFCGEDGRIVELNAVSLVDSVQLSRFLQEPHGVISQNTAFFSRFLQEPHGVTSQKTPFFGILQV
jgi:hypothetical protein